MLLKAGKHSDDPRGYICKVADLGLSRWFGDSNLKTHTITCTLGTMAYQVRSGHTCTQHTCDE